MKKILFFSLIAMLAFAGVVVASNAYNFGNTDTNELLKYIFDTDNGHNHDGTSSRTVTVASPYGSLNGAAGVTGVANGIEFEGATANGYETTLDVADATADVTYRLPVAAAGTYGVMVSSLATNAPDVANSVTGGTATLIFEGATANAHEATITPTDPTADVVWTLPTGAASTVSFVSSSLATNFAEVVNSVTGGTNSLIYEGTADAYEIILAAADATGADKTITLPNITGTSVVANATYAPTAALRFSSGTIVSGQTAIAVTMTGNTAGNMCIASAQESPSNACYVKNVVAGTDNVTVTVNTDPGASNLDLAVMCWN